MGNRAVILFRDEPSAAAGLGIAARPSAGMSAVQTSLQVWPPMSAKDEAVFLLHTASEIEHTLMVQ